MLIRRPGQSWHALQPSIHDERALQTLLAQSPGLLPTSGPGELAVAANFRVGLANPLDLLGVGVDGRITLVECGRQEGSARRVMGGSALAIAAGLWRAPYEEFDSAFASRAGVPLAEAVSTLAQAGGLAWDESAFRSAVTATLAAGRFQLVLAVDVITDEIKRLVSYLNAGDRPGLSAVALGLRYLAEEGIEILFPTVYQGEGVNAPVAAAPPAPPAQATPAAQAPAAAASPPPPPPPPPAAPAASQVTAPPPAPRASAPTPPAAKADKPAATDPEAETTFFTALEASCLPAAVAAVRQLYNTAVASGRELQWGQGEHPSVTAVFDVGGRPVGVWSCYTDLKPSFVINFEWLVPHVSTDALERVAAGLGQLQSVPERLAGLSEANYRRRLALAVNAVLAQPNAAEVISGALAELTGASATTSGAR